jgi:dinuclear metal center YbgI/SA1388 family protein
MKIKNLISFLETIAPPVYQESYDNAGLIVGDADAEISGVLLCLDSTEEVLEEAKELGCNLVIAHHPIVFKGLKRFNGNHYVERVVINAIKNDIAIYAIHTNLDNVYYQGVNAMIAGKLGLTNTKILAPKKGLKKLIAYVHPNYSEAVRNAIFSTGAGAVNGLRDHSHSSVGVTHEEGSSTAEVKLEILFPMDLQREVINALLKHYPVENPVYEILTIENDNEEIGSGMIGELEEPLAETVFLRELKRTMKAGVVRHTKLRNRKVRKVAVCGGSGGFLLNHAIRQKADVFVTADYKYHEFFDADGKIVIADIGHYESEQFTINLLHEIISEKFSIFAAHCTKVNTNPVKYL